MKTIFAIIIAVMLTGCGVTTGYKTVPYGKTERQSIFACKQLCGWYNSEPQNIVPYVPYQPPPPPSTNPYYSGPSGAAAGINAFAEGWARGEQMSGGGRHRKNSCVNDCMANEGFVK